MTWSGSAGRELMTTGRPNTAISWSVLGLEPLCCTRGSRQLLPSKSVNSVLLMKVFVSSPILESKGWKRSTANTSFLIKLADLICMLLDPITLGGEDKLSNFQTRIFLTSPWLSMANKCLPSGDIRKPVIFGNWESTASVGTGMLSAGLLCASATKQLLAMSTMPKALENLEIKISSLKKSLRSCALQRPLTFKKY